MNTADQTAKAGCRASTTIFTWLYWRNTPPVQSDQLCSIGAAMTSATSLSVSIYNLLLYGSNICMEEEISGENQKTKSCYTVLLYIKNLNYREKDEVTSVESEVSLEYLRRHFKEGKFAPNGPASDALGR